MSGPCVCWKDLLRRSDHVAVTQLLRFFNSFAPAGAKLPRSSAPFAQYCIDVSGVAALRMQGEGSTASQVAFLLWSVVVDFSGPQLVLLECIVVCKLCGTDFAQIQGQEKRPPGIAKLHRFAVRSTCTLLVWSPSQDILRFVGAQTEHVFLK